MLAVLFRLWKNTQNLRKYNIIITSNIYEPSPNSKITSSVAP